MPYAIYMTGEEFFGSQWHQLARACAGAPVRLYVHDGSYGSPVRRSVGVICHMSYVIQHVSFICHTIYTIYYLHDPPGRCHTP
jgi:hypothetical protein